MVAEASERRRHTRVGITLPVRVQGYLDGAGSWDEISTTFDVSPGGACFPLEQHEVLLGQVLQLSMALPKRMRQYDLNDASYRVYALVRGVRRNKGKSRVGVMFFGKYPPRGFYERPAMRFLLPGDKVATSPMPHGLREATADVRSAARAAAALIESLPDGLPSAPRTEELPEADPPALQEPLPLVGDLLAPPERRQGPRRDIFVNFTLSMVDENGEIREELTVADNLGRGGARVMTTLGFKVGDVVLLREVGGDFSARAEVRAISRVQPAVDRLHLHFLDKEAPTRLLPL